MMMRAKIGPSNRSTWLSLIALGMAVLLSLAGARAAKAQNGTALKPQLTESQAIALQKKFQDASMAADIAAVSALMADDALFVHGSAAVQTKAEYLNSLKSGQLKLTTYELKEGKVVLFDGGAIVSGPTEVVLAPGTVGPQAFRVEMRVSSVWVAKPSGWRLVLVQGTPIQAPPPAAPPNAPAR
jgi:ketosteroid isomerase-like protein